MATTLVLTDGAAQWLTGVLAKKEDDWHWDHQNPPSDDDQLYLREVKQALGAEAGRAAGDRWEGPGSR